MPQTNRSLKGERSNPDGMPGTPVSIHPIALSKDDRLRVEAHWVALLSREEREIQAAGENLLKRVAHPNWSVEWNLPRWLGRRAGLSENEQQQLVLANVAGLGYIRLADDARDGEGPFAGSTVVNGLAKILFDASKTAYRGIVGNDSWFWEQFDSCLEVWREAELPRPTSRANPEPIEGINQGLEDFGAPLFICCAAASVLAGNREGYAVWTKPVRHYLRAAVVYDHFKDWTQDLAAGRDNLFVQAFTGVQSSSANPEAARQRVALAMIDGRSMDAYIHRLKLELIDAAEAALDVGMPEFAEHLEALQSEICRSGDEMVAGINALLDRAMGVLKVEVDPNRIR